MPPMVGIYSPALAPLVPWQPAQVLASMEGVRTPSAWAARAAARRAAARGHLGGRFMVGLSWWLDSCSGQAACGPVRRGRTRAEIEGAWRMPLLS